MQKDTKMRILIVNRAMGTLFGGGESFDLNAARYLTKRGHRVTVITAKPLLRRPLEYPDVNVVYMSSPNLRRYAYLSEHINKKLSAVIYHLDNWLFERQVFKWLSTREQYKRFDVIQCCSLFRLPRWVLSRWQLPVVSWLPGPPSGLTRKTIMKLISHPNFGLFAHGAPVEALKRMGLEPGKDFFVVEPGIELAVVDSAKANREELKRSLKIADDVLIGITVARLVPVKNIGFLIRGLVLALNKGVNCHWLIIGDGPEKEKLKQLAQKLGVSSNIHFLGYRPNAEVHQLLAASNVYALTSTYESFSISTLEAMAHKLPVIATEVGYLQVMVKDSGAGILVPSNDENALANALVELASKDELRQELGDKGRKYAEKFDWSIIVKKLKKVYEYVIQK